MIWLIVIASGIVIGITVNWRIATKAGYEGQLSLLMLVPFANFIILLMFAFSEWPIERGLNARRAASGGPSGAGSLGVGGARSAVAPATNLRYFRDALKRAIIVAYAATLISCGPWAQYFGATAVRTPVQLPTPDLLEAYCGSARLDPVALSNIVSSSVLVLCLAPRRRHMVVCRGVRRRVTLRLAT